MTAHSLTVSTVILFLVAGSAGGAGPAPARAFEVGEGQTGELPEGKEADGIIGDFVLENGLIEALVSGALPGRKANMGTNYTGETPGNIYDLCVAGSRNDQLTLFAPGNLEGPLSSVRVARPRAGEAGIIAERTAARGRGREERHRYALREGWRHLLIVSEYAARADEEWKLKPEPFVKGLLEPTTHAGITFADAMNPADRQGYAWAAVAHEGSTQSLEPVTLKKGDRRTYAIAVAPGRSPAEAFGVIAALRGPTGVIRAKLHEKGRGIGSARLDLWLDEKSVIPAYPARDGSIEVALPPGKYRYAARDAGRPVIGGEVEVRAGSESAIDLPMEKAARIVFDVTDGAVPGKKCPLKAQIIGLGLTPDPDLGSPLQAHGCANQYHSENGWFEVQVPPGEYRVILTRGIEYSHREVRVKVEPGKDSVVAAELRRIVDTTGWISTDFHSHSTPSGDNYCGTDDRVINLAAEHIEFAATTEHNRLYDWGPHIRRLGLADEMSTTVGIELTGSGAHFNAFPFRATRWVQDGGAPTWQKDPRLNAIVLRDFQGGGPDRYVQLNHPQVGEFFRDRDADGVPDGGFRDLELLIDAAEVWSEEILNPQPWLVHKDAATGKETPYQNRTFAWLQLLNQGRDLHVVAVSDAHSVFTNGAGGWRTYVPSSTDDPARIDHREVVRNAKAGRMVVTNGPYLEVSLDDGTLPGGRTRRTGTVELDVKVQCTDWIEIDRVQVLVNGRQLPDLDFTRARKPEMFGSGVVKFQRRIAVPLAEDAHLIVAAVGEGHFLRTGYGRAWQAGMHPCAFSNPIFIDTDGDGFEPNGDTLGHPLPTGKKP